MAEDGRASADEVPARQASERLRDENPRVVDVANDLARELLECTVKDDAQPPATERKRVNHERLAQVSACRQLANRMHDWRRGAHARRDGVRGELAWEAVALPERAWRQALHGAERELSVVRVEVDQRVALFVEALQVPAWRRVTGQQSCSADKLSSRTWAQSRPR